MKKLLKLIVQLISASTATPILLFEETYFAVKTALFITIKTYIDERAI